MGGARVAASGAHANKIMVGTILNHLACPLPMGRDPTAPWGVGLLLWGEGRPLKGLKDACRRCVSPSAGPRKGGAPDAGGGLAFSFAGGSPG